MGWRKGGLRQSGDKRPRQQDHYNKRARLRCNHDRGSSQSWAGDPYDGKVRADGKLIAIAMVRITEAGRRVLAAED
jgi:hypothetical protein